jgi:hypothetical protein
VGRTVLDVGRTPNAAGLRWRGLIAFSPFCMAHSLGSKVKCRFGGVMIREGRNSPSTTIRNNPNEIPMIRATVASSPPNPGTNLAKVPWGVERAVAAGAKHRSRFFQQEGCPSLWAQRIASVCAQVPDCLRFGKRGARQRGRLSIPPGGCRRTRSGPTFASERTHPLPGCLCTITLIWTNPRLLLAASDFCIDGS